MDSIAELLDKSGTTHQVNDEEQQQMLDKFHSALKPVTAPDQERRRPP